MRTAPLIVATLLSLGCRPPEAPQDYEALVGYIFEHTADEDEDDLLAGLDNLTSWLSGDNLLLAQDGMTITNLPDSAVGSLSVTMRTRRKASQA